MLNILCWNNEIISGFLMKSSKEQHLFEIEIFCFIKTFEQ